MRMEFILATAFCGAITMACLPSQVTASPIGAAGFASAAATPSVEQAYYRGHRGAFGRGAYNGAFRPGYGGSYGAGAAAAGIAGATAGVLGAGVAGAAGYGYPSYGYGDGGFGYQGYGYSGSAGGNPCWRWDAFAGWVWSCR
jgi:hypothetical protein